MVINKIVFTSPEAIVEFSRVKINARRSSKPFEHIQIISSVRSIIRPFLLRARQASLRLLITQPRYAKNVK